MDMRPGTTILIFTPLSEASLGQHALNRKLRDSPWIEPTLKPFHPGLPAGQIPFLIIEAVVNQICSLKNLN